MARTFLPTSLPSELASPVLSASMPPRRPDWSRTFPARALGHLNCPGTSHRRGHRTTCLGPQWIRRAIATGGPTGHVPGRSSPQHRPIPALPVHSRPTAHRTQRVSGRRSPRIRCVSRESYLPWPRRLSLAGEPGVPDPRRRRRPPALMRHHALLVRAFLGPARAKGYNAFVALQEPPPPAVW